MIKSKMFILGFWLLVSCSSFEKTEIEVEAVNELLGCEEENFHMRIVKADGIDSLVGQIILPELIDEIKTREILAVMFPEDKRFSAKFRLKGNLSKNAHNRQFEGCIGAKVFRVTEIKMIKALSRPPARM